MQKYLAETGQMENTWRSQSGFVHQDIKADMDSLPPPPFNVQLLGTVYFSLNCIFSSSKGAGMYLGAPAVQTIWWWLPKCYFISTYFLLSLGYFGVGFRTQPYVPAAVFVSFCSFYIKAPWVCRGFHFICTSHSPPLSSGNCGSFIGKQSLPQNITMK